MKLIKVDVELEDSIFNGFIPGLTKTSKFVIPDSTTDMMKMNSVFNLEIHLKGEKKKFKRKVYSFLDMMGDIGGLHDALFLLAGILLNSYNSSMFDLALVKSLFVFQKTPNR